jgi:hypothetical protein
MDSHSKFGGVDVIHLTKEEVLRQVSEYQIFKFYCKNFIDLDKAFCSDLRYDKSPSCFIKAFSKGLFYKDFGGIGESHDCFSYVQTYMKVKFNIHLNFQETLKVIANDFGVIKKLNNKEIIPSLNYLGLPDKLNRSNSIIRIKKRDWKEYDIYWDKYYLTRDILKFYNVIPVTDYWVSSNNNELINIYTESNDDFAYSYEHGDGMRKILRPNAEKSKKWLSNIPGNVFSGWDQLEQQADILIVTKSLKDCMVFRLFGYNAISPQSEMIFLNHNQFNLLTMRFKQIVINYDNDDAGLINMKKFAQAFGIKSFIIPDGIKDVSDYISIKGYDLTKQLIKNLKNYLT